jgi:hypothetical protein
MRNAVRLLVTVVMLTAMFTELNAVNRRQNLAAATVDPAVTYRATGPLADRIVITPTRGCAGMNAPGTVEASRVSTELYDNGYRSVEFCGIVGEVIRER